MSSTFFGLNIAASGLRTFQTAVNTTANNISNVETEGYSRQEAIKQATAAIRVNAPYGSEGTGVEVSNITRIHDQYYDEKYWENSSKLGEVTSQNYYLGQIESYLRDDDSVVGFTSIFNDMYNDLDNLKKDATNLSTRNDYISGSLKLTDYFNSINGSLTSLQEDVNQVIYNKTSTINSISEKIAVLNKQINVIEVNGGAANSLRDSRGLLIDELSDLVPVDVEERKVTNSNYPDMYTGGTTFTVKTAGQILVEGDEYNELECVIRDNNQKVNATDADGLYDIYWKDTGNELNVNTPSMKGGLSALFSVRDGNSSESFKGTLDNSITNVLNDAGKVVTQLTISNPSMTDPSQVNIPSHGSLSIKNTTVEYESYELQVQTDAAGNETYTYKFKLSQKYDATDFATRVGEEVSVGEDIDFMGIPYYQSQMNEFIRNYTKNYNDKILQDGVDLDGNQTGVYFVGDDLANGGEMDYASRGYVESTVAGITTRTYKNDYYYLNLSGANVTVADEVVEDPSKMAAATKDAFSNGAGAYDLLDDLADTKDKDVVFRGSVGRDFLQGLLSDISVDTQRVTIFQDNYTNIQKAITNQRMSISGVDNDEEGLDLIKFQNAYNNSSKLVQVLSEMYERLITQTGV